MTMQLENDEIIERGTRSEELRCLKDDDLTGPFESIIKLLGSLQASYPHYQNFRIERRQPGPDAYYSTFVVGDRLETNEELEHRRHIVMQRRKSDLRKAKQKEEIERKMLRELKKKYEGK